MQAVDNGMQLQNQTDSCGKLRLVELVVCGKSNCLHVQCVVAVEMVRVRFA